MADASVWRREEVALTLSKGEVTVRKPNVLALVLNDKEGQVPDSLSRMVLDSFDPTKRSKKKEPWKMERSDMPKMSAFIDLVVRASLVDPVIKDNPVYENGEIHIDDLDLADKIKIFEWAMPTEEVRAAERFPDR